jgi:hypothetical protein
MHQRVTERPARNERGVLLCWAVCQFDVLEMRMEPPRIFMLSPVAMGRAAAPDRQLSQAYQFARFRDR